MPIIDGHIGCWCLNPTYLESSVESTPLMNTKHVFLKEIMKSAIVQFWLIRVNQEKNHKSHVEKRVVMVWLMFLEEAHLCQRTS